MPQAVVAIIGKLVKSGSEDIDLIVHSHSDGEPVAVRGLREL
jgi:hypothetical protein